VRRGLLQAADRARGEILDEYEASGLGPGARDAQGLARERTPHESGDHAGVARARPVGDPEPEDRVLEPVELAVGLAVHLAGELGGRVEMARRWQHCVFVDRSLRAVAVDPGRAGEDDPFDT